MKSLSILLPTYNCYCVKLVETLHSQCEAIIGLCYEIIVADDGSPEKEYIVRNREIERLTNVRYIFSEENVGRSRIRNILVREAQYEWILFIDGDLALENPLFVKNYLEAKGDIIVGGIEILNLQGTKCNVLQKGNLRWLVEQEHVSKNSAAYRRRHVLELHTNFLVCRNTMIKYPFDESFMRYGYEDVMLGKTLVEAGLHVEHT